MSDTPRTDAKEKETANNVSDYNGVLQHAHYGWKFSRQLERELEQARAELREAKEAFNYLEQTHRTEIELHGKTREELTQLRAAYAERDLYFER